MAGVHYARPTWGTAAKRAKWDRALKAMNKAAFRMEHAQLMLINAEGAFRKAQRAFHSINTNF